MAKPEGNLVKELDSDLEAFLQQKIEESKNKPRPFNFDNMSVDQVAEEIKQHPVFMTDFDETKPMSEAVEALQALKYESNDQDENALSYKEDGNKNFGRKKYRWAIDNYTAGLNCHPTDTTLSCVLLTNRAAAHFYIGNFRSSINDCIEALQHNPSHKKAWIRVIHANKSLSKHHDVIQWCDKALSKFPDEKIVIESRQKSLLEIKKKERDGRMGQKNMKKEKGKRMEVVQAIKSRKIQFKAIKSNDDDDDDDDDDGDGDHDGDGDGGWLRMVTKEHNGARVQLVEGTQQLQWPVMFLYPQHQQSDFVLAFNELSTFEDQLAVVLTTTPPWDTQQQYTLQNVNIYHEERKSNGNSHHHLIPPHFTLLQILSSKRFCLSTGLLVFFVFPKKSPAEEIFLNENNS